MATLLLERGANITAKDNVSEREEKGGEREGWKKREGGYAAMRRVVWLIEVMFSLCVN